MQRRLLTALPLITLCVACEPGFLSFGLGEEDSPGSMIGLPDGGGQPPMSPPMSPPPSTPDASITPDAMPPSIPRDMCGDLRVDPLIHYGTRSPSLLGLSTSQLMSIGLLDLGGGLCSGLLIHPRFVLTAAHCATGSRASFMAGDTGSGPNTRIGIRRFISHGSADIALAELDRDATTAIPSITPIPILVEDMNSSWIGRQTEASGYGRTESGSTGTRYFSNFPITQLAGVDLVINAGGRGGVCNGDSGGPLMVRTESGETRVIAVVSRGDGTCTYQAIFTRVDSVRDWIESHTGPTVTEPQIDCPSAGSEGRCFEDVAMWCDGSRAVSENCSTSETCGWDDGAAAFRCIPRGTDPCGGVDSYGSCQGEVAVWCDAGEIRRRDCGSCSETCGDVASAGGIYCRPDPCMGLDYHGRCVDGRAEYCRDGEFRSRNCAAEGLRCGWVNDELGNWCY